MIIYYYLTSLTFCTLANVQDRRTVHRRISSSHRSRQTWLWIIWFLPFAVPACFWSVGGVNPCRHVEKPCVFDPGTSCYEATALTTKPPCRPCVLMKPGLNPIFCVIFGFFCLHQDDVILSAKQVEDLQTDFTERMRLLRTTVQARSAVPTSQVFVSFLCYSGSRHFLWHFFDSVFLTACKMHVCISWH